MAFFNTVEAIGADNDLNELRAGRLYIGLTAGEPSGVSFTSLVTNSLGFQLEFGASFAEDTRHVLAIDGLYYFWPVMGAMGVDVCAVPYAGLGFRMAGARGALGDRLGLRVPFGVSLLSSGGTTEFFAQVAPGLALMPKSDASFDLSVGARLAF